MSATMPLATVVVVPRERFSHTAATLDSILAVPAPPFRLVCVDGGAPTRIRTALAARAAAGEFELVRVDRYVTPNEARNIGLRHVRTKYVVFIDNDAVVTPGWLQALVGCAEETGAAICGPLQLIGPPEAGVVHLVGGTAHISEREGKRTFVDAHQFANQRMDDVRPQLTRAPTELIEFHCMLVRMDVFDRLGPLDERLLNVQEHADLCMRARAAGLTVVVEPASVVAYVPPPPFAWSDLPYFLLRWSDDWTRRSLAHFAAAWGLDPDDPGLASTVAFARWHRRLPARTARRVVERIAHRSLGAWAGRLRGLERAAARTLARWTERVRRQAHD